ncbi:MAG: XdhC family protein [Alphaproteobacteria bacterium]|nr:XdhC family protein [Alphaproteobacteria bacterium]
MTEQGTSDRAQPLRRAGEWAAAGEKVALATVVETWGSAPCPAGSQMAVSEKARFAGSVSGGCIETSVVSESLEIIKEGKPQLLRYGISNEEGYAAGLTCGGNVGVLVEPLDARLLAEFQGEKPFVRAVEIQSGRWAVLRGGKVSGALAPAPDVLAQMQAAAQDGVCRVVGEGADAIFVHPVRPSPRLIVVGAVRIAQTLAPMAAAAGFEVLIIDPRPAFASPERFPGFDLVREWPDKALPKLNVDAGTAVVTLTHDSKPDDMALILALRSPAFYVGALGSRKTHAKRVARLQAAGVTEAEIARIRAPVGLDIDAETPAEIAVSIVAEVVAAKNGKSFRK